MPSRQPEAMGDQLTRRLRILDVGKHDDHRPSADPQRQVRHGVTKVRLHIVRPNRIKGFRDALQLRTPALGLDERLDLIVEGHQAHAIAISLGNPSEHQRRVDRVVELL
jgi:hypothetical protein